MSEQQPEVSALNPQPDKQSISPQLPFTTTDRSASVTPRAVEMRPIAAEAPTQAARITRASRPFILVLIDGDGLLFDDDLMRQGLAGGREAGRRLWSAIRDHHAFLANTPGPAEGPVRLDSTCIQTSLQGEDRIVERNPTRVSPTYPIVINIYTRLKGLRRAWLEHGVSGKDFDGFWDGLSHAHKLISVIDAGRLKEVADRKLCAQLELHADQEGCKTIYAGITHDSGYVTDLYTLETEQRCDKIILLKGEDQTPPAMDAMNLPTLVIAGLFRSQPLPPLAPRRPDTAAPQKPPSTEAPQPLLEAEDIFAVEAVSLSGDDDQGQLYSEVAGMRVAPPPSPIVRPLAVVEDSVDEEDILLSAASNVSGTSSAPSAPNYPQYAPTRAGRAPVKGTRRVLGSVRDWKPRACHWFYLTRTGCQRTDDPEHTRLYGHEYDPTLEQYAELRKIVKRLPCAGYRSGKCPLPEAECIYSHKCPDGTFCNKRGSGCWFDDQPNGHD